MFNWKKYENSLKNTGGIHLVQQNIENINDYKYINPEIIIN